MSSLPSPRIPINTVEELFDKLKWEEGRLEVSWSVYDSWNFIVTAHHLYHDWIGDKNLSAATSAQKARHQSLDTLAPQVAKLFVAVANIANGSKHFDLHKTKKYQIVTEVTEPEESDYDSYFFGEMIYIRYEDYRVSMAAASDLIIRSLSWIIHDGDVAVLNEISDAMTGLRVTA